MSNQRKLLDNSTTMPSLGDSAAECLRKAAVLFSKTLTPELVEIWAHVLKDYSPQAIEYAFENWMRNGEYFPKPVNIEELCKAYMGEVRYRPIHFEHHGKGYGENDIKILWQIWVAKATELKRPLTLEEKEACWNEMNKKTGRKCNPWDEVPA